MDFTALLTPWLATLPLLARVVGFMLAAPPFSSQLAPTSVKIGLALVFWLGLASQGGGPGVEMHFPEMTGQSFSELLIGLTLGFFIQIMFSAFDIAGELLSNGMGLSFPGAFDPVASETSGPVAGLIQMVGLAIFVANSGMEQSLNFLTSSLALAKPGEMPSLGQIQSHMLEFVTQCFLLGITSSISIWGSLLLANLLMLISSRLAGGLNLMNSGLPLLLIIGMLLILACMVPMSLSIWAGMPKLSDLMSGVPK